MANAFRGGVSIAQGADKKAQAAAQPLRVLNVPTLHLCLRVRGTLLTPCVGEGDLVRVGDRVAEDPAGHIPPLHSGVSGKVVAVERLLPAADGGDAPTLVIENDGNNTKGNLLPPLAPDGDRTAILRRMYDAGLIGMGGAGFPTHLKYRDGQGQWLLINVCECEPYLAGDVRLAVEQAAVMVQGARLLATAAGVDKEHTLFCTEAKRAAQALCEQGVRVRLLPKRYPQGGERQLVRAVLHRDIPAGIPPSEEGIFISNAATAVAMGDAARGLPLTHRPLTVSGQVEEPRNFMVPIGTPFACLAQQVTPTVRERQLRYIAGGPMTGRRLTSLQAGVPKTCGGLILLTAREFADTPCIRCGACVRVCPAGLTPFRIDEGAQAGDRRAADAWQATACISCGCCSYVCPAGRRLAARIGGVRRRLLEEGETA